ncbi:MULTISPECIES: LysR family transcriptional regulator [Ramlibacter]|uniref:LysR family transcriptional regulator n=1 Tax=Ramlibacter aquaticus TaxID=2780094 RepID=A0ABR9SFT7_9BURK|nr:MULTISPECIES: LysR family transcriptional regulator [Ramlibacter]MBE7941120.1 LysR family transcriptional regulator [Ramlibacter aquaticus]
MTPPTPLASQDLQFFSLLVRCGSLTAAARELGLTTPAISKRLAALEQKLGVTLLHRTTRRLALTPEGQALLQGGRRIVGEIEALGQQLQGATQEPAGLLRVNATLGFGRMQVAPAVASFRRRHPRVDVQLQLSASPPAAAEDAWDVCVRFGALPDSRLVARQLAPNRRLLCASPGYLAARGAPRSPAELAQHDFIAIRQADDVQGLLRLATGRRQEAVRLAGGLSTNDGEVAVGWALAGLGVVLRAEWDVARYLRSGRLVQLLPQWQAPPADIHAVYPARLQHLSRVRAFVDHLAQHLARGAPPA